MSDGLAALTAAELVDNPDRIPAYFRTFDVSIARHLARVPAPMPREWIAASATTPTLVAVAVAGRRRLWRAVVRFVHHGWCE